MNLLKLSNICYNNLSVPVSNTIKNTVKKSSKKITQGFMPINFEKLKNIASNKSLPQLESEVRKHLKDLSKYSEVNPQDIDNMLTFLTEKAGGTISDTRMLPKGSVLCGRKKLYELPNGQNYFLEVHDDTCNNKVIARVCENYGNNKAGRKYLTNKGKFEANTYTDAKTHLNTSAAESRWMFPQNGTGVNLDTTV